ncbi:hypothetical protein C1T06_22970 [Vibrio parahaemolyticus]|nr:hypothetical protein C1T06_22970 [Vibrio parahaemolyticus]
MVIPDIEISIIRKPPVLAVFLYLVCLIKFLFKKKNFMFIENKFILSYIFIVFVSYSKLCFMDSQSIKQ